MSRDTILPARVDAVGDFEQSQGRYYHPHSSAIPAAVLWSATPKRITGTLHRALLVQLAHAGTCMVCEVGGHDPPPPRGAPWKPLGEILVC